MNIALRTTQLSIGYSAKGKPNFLLKNLNLSLEEGQLVCFMGPNGVGKSTLVRTLAGLQQPLEGRVDLAREHDLAVVLTDRVSATHMRVEELVAFGRYPYLNWSGRLDPRDSEVVKESMAVAHISHLVGRRLDELSDGQLQLVMIARALAQETTVLLLDEPTSHLDLDNRLEVMNVLRHLTRVKGKTILVATHELDLALQTADRIWLATPGKTIVHGLPEDLVLDGSFDAVFQFKGFDLKTGKVQHPVFRSRSIQVEGTGYEFLWTKNALERSGYEITAKGDLKVVCQGGAWEVGGRQFSTLADLLDHLHRSGSTSN